jgi:gliding motility-associated-like protein
MNKVLLLFFTLLSINCFSQFSKTHYIPPLAGSEAQSAQEQFIYISTPSTRPINFKINQLGGSIINGIVSQSSPYLFNAGYGTNSQLHVKESLISTILTNKGYIIEADDVVYVSARVIAGNTNQAGALVSKGLAALGKQFRIGALTNTGISSMGPSHLTFIAVLATENNTTITFNDIKAGVILINNSGGSTPASIILNSGESYVLAVKGPTNANRDGLIGSLVTADKPIAVNCGSYAGTNGDNNLNVDLGFDQIVPAERTGKEYIFIKSTGQNFVEKVLLVANENDTEIYSNGATSPITTLNAGGYIALDGANYSTDGNLYVKTSKNVFAYQSVGDNSRIDQANQELFFVPPLSCETPTLIDNIPNLNQIGSRTFTGRVTIVTEVNASLDFLIDGINYSLATVPAIIDGPKNVLGNSNYVTYTITGLSGNVSVYSSGQLYLASYGSDGAATYGGFYSGFTFKPQVTFDKINSVQSNCIPNTLLSVSDISGFDTFQWYFNSDPITTDGKLNNYRPTKPGYYYVKATIAACGTELISDEIPVSACPPDSDQDLVNDNIDIDLDNDGVQNCTESFGDLSIDLTNPNNGTINSTNYTNSFIGTLINTTNSIALPFKGKNNGDFITELPKGTNSSISYEMKFNQPISIAMEYISNANPTDLVNSNSEFVVKSPINKTITVLNSDNQLLIDTNYDGIYESGITEYSSFEIRFRLNSTVPLAPGAGTFSFRSYLTDSFSITHTNLSDTVINKATFTIFATCIPKDTDLDDIPDQLDKDSDADGIPDLIESQINTSVALSNSDANKDGLDDAFEPGFTPIDTDNDLIPDYLDLDSDNDGIYDAVETGSSGTDTDGDGIKNYRELDSDNDLCNDVIEAGFADPNNDGLLGAVVPPTVDANGIVTSGIGYSTPSDNYITAAPIVITTQPTVLPTCNLQNATITITDNGGNSYRWQISTNGTTWTNVPDDATYSGGVTNTLAIKSVKSAMNGYTYRVQLNKVGNSCGLLSNETTLTVYPLPVVNPVTIVQCDDDSDGFSNFNLTVKNNTISSDPTAQFSYYISFSGAENSEPNKLINNPLSFKNTTAGSMSVWARTENSNGCFSVSQVNLVVSTTQIPPSYNMTFEICDDLGTANDDTDGIATFDFSSVTTDILRILPDPNTAYSIKYYKNEQDALSENDEILNTTNYRNEGYRDEQRIWVRVESTADNACYGLSPRILLKVNPKPNIDTNEDQQDDELVCSNLPSFFVRLDSGIQDGSPESDYTYQWTKDNMSLTSETMSFLDVNAVGTYSVKVNSAFGCSRTRTIKVTASDVAAIQSIDIVDLAETNTVTVNVTGQGIYEYSLDAPNGPFQLSNFFANVSAGIHDVYVNDQNGCGTITKAIAVLGVPKFFTPNGDGFNDYWNLKGANATFNVKSIIYIYDRYGKLVFQVDPSSRGWDGTYNKSPLPADDYWFTIKLENGREATGHFSLKR